MKATHGKATHGKPSLRTRDSSSGNSANNSNSSVQLSILRRGLNRNIFVPTMAVLPLLLLLGTETETAPPR